MWRRFILPALVVPAWIVVALPLWSQEPAKDGLPRLADLHTPTSPAFVILGIAPTDVARPSTPEALALGILTASRDGSIFPRNYSVEFAPYWMRSRSQLTFGEWFQPTVAQAIRQTFTISLGTTRGTGADSTTTSMGVGIRLVPLPGEPSKGTEGIVESIRQRQRSFSDAAERLTKATTQSELERIEREIEVLNREQEQDVARFEKADKERVGARWEIAMAAAGRFPDHALDGAELSRLGLWTTLAYQSGPSIDTALVLRYLRDFAGKDENVADVGGKLALIVDDLSLDLELVKRWIFDASDESADGEASRGTFTFDSTYRLVGSARYRLEERLSITASFGTGHREAEGPRHPLVTLLGVDFEFGDDPAVEQP